MPGASLSAVKRAEGSVCLCFFLGRRSLFINFVSEGED